MNPPKKRAKRTKTIRHRDEVQWEFIYAERSEETKRIRAEAAHLLYEFGAAHQFFQNTAKSPARARPLADQGHPGPMAAE
jgi:hypothetical protein